jgi:hypothetical protein
VRKITILLSRYAGSGARPVHQPIGSAATRSLGLVEEEWSAVLSLDLEGEVVYRGENTFRGFPDRPARGYVESGKVSLRQKLPAGSHDLAAELEVREGFGWGLILAACGEGLRWLPAELG